MLSEKAMLVSLTVRTWSATVQDKDIASTAEADARAERGSVRARKLLVPKEALDPVNRAARELRECVYQHTAPWSDTGWRLLPTDRWGAFNDALALRKEDFTREVQTFLARYPRDAGEAFSRLGALFDASKYPTVSALARRFSCETDYCPVPQANHFVVDLGAEDAARVRDSVERATKDKFEAALRSAAADLKSYGVSIRDALDKDGGRVIETTIVNAIRTARLLISLNVYSEPNINAACRSLLATLDGSDISMLRNRPVYRAQVAEAVGQATASLADAFPGEIF